MNRQFLRGAALASSALVAGLATPSYAQSAAVAGDGTDIVVTARRVEERLQDVPISITVLSQQQITDRNITSTTDLATYTPSLIVNPNYGPDKATFSIRGFNQDLNTGPTVGVYFAEVIAPRGVSQTLGGNGVGAGGLMDLQNVQVLKGPQGTLFGRNTTGGAILLVPQKPKSTFGGWIEGTYGNYNERRVTGVLNVPLSDTFKVRFAGDYNKRDGYAHNISGIGPKDLQNINYTALRMSVLANPTETLENYFIATYSDSNNNGGIPKITNCAPSGAGIAAIFIPLCQGQLARTAAAGGGKYDVDSSNPFPKARTQQWQAINTTTWEASDNLTVKNIASYGEFRETSRTSIFGEDFRYPAGSPFAGQTLIFSIAAATPGGYYSRQSTLTEELQFQGRSSDGKLTWQVGGYYELSSPLGASNQRNPSLIFCTNYLTQNCSSGPVPGSFNSPSIRTTVHNNGIYAQSTYKLGKFDLTAGIRYTWDKTDATGQNVIYDLVAPNTYTLRCTNPLRFPSPTVPGRGMTVTDRAQCTGRIVAKSQKPTWLLNAGYNFTDDIMAYAKYARGYRQGFINTNAVGFESWNPDKLDSYEIGAKASFRGRLSGYLNIAAFKNNLTNQQLQATGNGKPGTGLPTVSTIINAGKSKLDGVEVDASVGASGLRLDVGYAYLKTKLKSVTVPPIDPNSPFASVIPVVSPGGRLVFVPTHRLTATLAYNLPTPESWGKISISGTYTYTSNMLLNATATLTGVAPATNLINANLNWKNVGGSPVDLGLFGTNLTKVYQQTGIAGTFGSVGFEGVRFGEPRIYGVRVRYNFGE